MPFDGSGRHWPGKGFLWRSAAEVANGFSQSVAARARELADDEYRRLLYVGMTRAEDRLIVCGYHGKRTPSPGTWHSLVMRALAGAEETESRPHPVDEGDVFRFRWTKFPPLAAAEAGEQLEAEIFALVPASLYEPLPVVEDLPRPLSPSGASALIDETTEPIPDRRSPVLDADGEPGMAVRRGLAMHKLLQMLPDLAEERHMAAARRYLARAGSDWTEADREQALASVAGILADPLFAPLFAPGSRAEVSVMGSLTVKGKSRIISGKIDRLAVGTDRVFIVDYKTNRPAPATLADVPPAYILQLALYRALLKPLYPGRQVAAGLLFTEALRLIELPATAMDDALARLTEA
jgi:ATP-dependent helicase/nuclease subunit A